jgi:hypothetical protein
MPRRFWDDPARADLNPQLSACAALEVIVRPPPNLGTYSSLPVKPEYAARLTPEQIVMMREDSELQERAKQYAKENRESMSSGEMPIAD